MLGKLLLFLLGCSLFFADSSHAQYPSKPPRVLIVTAHPDDESGCAATVYKITRDMHGTVDLALMTNGEGGYKYSTLANEYYHLNITDEKVGRANLPRIRKKELEAAGKIIGVSHWTYFDQKDHKYSLNVHEALDSIWDVPLIQRGLKALLAKGHYDFIFTMLPTDSTHAHHKGAGIMALTAVNAMPAGLKRPVVLGMSVAKKGAEGQTKFTELVGYPITKITEAMPAFSFDRTQGFGYKHRLNYKIIVNWEIAEHKSQGAMQLGMNEGDIEQFWYFDLNAADGRATTKTLFDALAVNHYPELVYPGEK